MCGIIGYVGHGNVVEVLLAGLSQLEYRGYDSAGISLIKDGYITSIKAKGRLINLENKLEGRPLACHLGIGHTRWATHGAPSDENSHPHNSNNGKFSVVHNGIIENYMELREKLKKKGYVFYSDTDTEVIPNLIDFYYEGDILRAIRKTMADLKGSYALGIISTENPNQLVAIRKDSPLVIGVGKEESFIASDVPAILSYTKEIIYLNDGELAILNGKKVTIFNEDEQEIHTDSTIITWNAESAEKGGYACFTLKEINEL